MTPLARQLARQLLLPQRKQGPFWRTNLASLREALTDTHFFEATAVLPLVPEIVGAVEAQGAEQGQELVAQYTFLPAPKTWIEHRDAYYGCVGMLLEEDGEKAKELGAATSMSVTLFTEDHAGKVGEIGIRHNHYGYCDDDSVLSPALRQVARERDMSPGRMQRKMTLLGVALLLAINSPRIIGRRTRAPHKGLAREIARTPSAGIGPLRDWTEIKLEITKPAEIDDGEPHEATITGHRALHFCRKHIRVRLGKLEYVRAHWRGDPAVGVVRARYTVAAPGNL